VAKEKMDPPPSLTLNPSKDARLRKLKYPTISSNGSLAYKMAHCCTFCNYSTEKRFNLNRHTRTVHRDELTPPSPNVHVLPQNVSLPPKNVSLPPKNVSLPPKNVSLPPKNVSLPPKNVSLPPENVSPTPKNVSLDGGENNDDAGKAYKCDKCNKCFERRYRFIEHSAKCEGGINPLQCMSCLKIFTTRQAKHKHKACCKGLVVADKPNVIETQNNYNDCTINNNTNNNNIQINITNFNNENTNYITEEFARKCFENGVHGVTPMLDKIYFNEDHPENHNVRLRSLNHSIVEVHTEKGWVPDGLVNVIDRMIANSTGTIVLMISNNVTPTTDDVSKLNQITNIAPSHHKKIRERAKSKLIARRDQDTT
jgi:hypothetical protein